jgi:hypothetical protein
MASYGRKREREYNAGMNVFGSMWKCVCNAHCRKVGGCSRSIEERELRRRGLLPLLPPPHRHHIAHPLKDSSNVNLMFISFPLCSRKELS